MVFWPQECQTAQNGPILNFSNDFLKIQRGYILWIKLTSDDFRALCGGRFGNVQVSNPKQFWSVLCKNWHSWYQPVGPRPLTKIPFFLIFFSMLGLSFNIQTNVLSNGWYSFTNPCFLTPAPAQMALAQEKNTDITFLPKWTQKNSGQMDARWQRY